ncbi:putative membrane protein YfcA [Aequitasia blattaphilus]|uniref:Probable membrane transporter protein n=2 Tax=Aequitasia blattaphilus TaxID=2949332 RepID=A0ABT1EAR7_9FIRM|nr:sulfite exporter TauE/SafE family protein [Aequitasia blattaphilus]MCP1102903.1 sulfite exporter TauE/SafE family protein [Aequitasia blattaphilus]MCR8615543.1 sulfite exporter TauE/SafE family protein [Aequitasia blattaphilus]
MNSVTILRIVLSAWTLVFAVYLIKDCIKHKEDFDGKHMVALAIIGAVTNFLDTLGIGSFATTQAGFKFTNSSPDETMPGTLNVGDTIPVVTEALLFFGLIDIDPITLIALLAAAVIGAVVGAGIVSKWPVKQVRIALGAALIFLAIVMAARLLGVGPFGAQGTATALTGVKLVIGVVINCLLGALMTIGVGLYAPCMALVGALGMNISAAFPIMMGSCAFLMPSAGIRFIREGKYDRKASIMLTIFGVIGVFIAYFIVKSLPLTILTWVIIAVMLFTSFTFFKDASKA